MSMAHLGPSFDIHTGGVDLIFPHHEDEIAQSEAATGQTFVGTWLHCAHLRMGGAKMAKSTGNIARVGEVLAAGRLGPGAAAALISVHYRAGLNHSADSLAAAGAALDRLDAAVAALDAYAEDGPDDADAGRRASTPPGTDFGAALDDDLNVSAGLGRRVRPGPRPQPADRAADRCRPPTPAVRSRRCATSTACWRSCPTPTADDLEPAVAALLDARVAARAARDFAASDRLRDELAALGVTVEDTRDGQRWRRTVEVGHG